jgi:hypothetical protein
MIQSQGYGSDCSDTLYRDASARTEDWGWAKLGHTRDFDTRACDEAEVAGEARLQPDCLESYIAV